MLIPCVLLIVGFVLIMKGGDWFVDASVWVAEATGIPKILIGATIVSLATTLPEIFVTLLAVGHESYALGVGNAVGSVIANTGLILSLALIFAPGTIDKKHFIPQALIMLIAAAWLMIALNDYVLSPVECVPLLGLAGVFAYLNIKNLGGDSLDLPEEPKSEGKNSWVRQIMKFIFGAAGIIYGADLLVENGSKLAAMMGVSESIIGVTIVAVGTSLPELVTTITSIIKKHASMGIGNIIGANTINLTLLLGSAGILAGGRLTAQMEYMSALKLSLPRLLAVDLPVVFVLFAIMFLPTVICKGKFHRWQGCAMLALYALFIAFLISNM